ncbi:MAG: hypothetical protein K2N48_10095 [Muribaculaceae bacterium]|nr:hypothetical protein [Muribaculaceae bacterium]
MKKKHILTSLLCIAVMAVAASTSSRQSSGTKLRHGNEASYDSIPKIALAYVVDAGKRPLDPFLFTHLVYAFVEFNDDCDGIVIKKPEKLQAMLDLKQQNPDLKIIACIGGYKREGFSEMTRDKKKRKAFVKDIKHLVDSLGLDGIDLDWEFPTTENGGHTATPKDDKNYVAFVKELRKAIGKDKWISYYSNNSGLYIDHKGMAPYVSYVHVSGYNLAVPKEGEHGRHQSPLYPSGKFGDWSISKSIERHIDLGVPKEKILMGIPFFGRGKTPFPSYVECRLFDRNSDGMQLKWDDEACVPYYADETGDLVLGFDDERSIAEKFDFIRANHLPGVFVWNYDGDYFDQRLGKTIQKLSKGK